MICIVFSRPDRYTNLLKLLHDQYQSSEIIQRSSTQATPPPPTLSPSNITMPITGVFFIPSNPNAATALSTITERLHSRLADEPTPIGRWALEHKLMRDTPSCLPASASQRPTQPRYLQFLSLTYYPNHGFIYTSQPDHTTAHSHPHHQHPGAVPTPTAAQATPPSSQQAPGHTPTPSHPQTPSTAMVMTTVPLPSCTTLFQHFVYACQPFWCHRHTVTVPGGMAYDVGDFRVRVGDVRQTAPAARPRGTVVEIEWRGPTLAAAIAAQDLQRQHAPESGDGSGADDDSGVDVTFFPEGITEADVDAEYAAVAALIREFWGRLGIEGAREAILVPDVGREVKAQLRRLQAQGKQTGVRGATEPQSEEDPDPDAGVDVARQFMEIFRFNR